MTIKLKATESNTVTGNCFFNREVERKIISGKIEDGVQQLLTGQRRMGKSSIAREIGRQLVEEKGEIWNYIFVDIQACSSGAELVERLATELHRHAEFKTMLNTWFSFAGNHISKIEKLSVSDFTITLRDHLTAANWKNKGRELLQKIESSDKRTYLVLDEFPDVVTKVHTQEGIQGVEALMEWLRVETQAIANNKKISLLISGSIGLEPILQRLELSDKINHLASYRLKPWKREIAKNCFQALANYRNIPVEDDGIDYLLDQLGVYIPFHIQRSWAKLYEYLQEEDKVTATREDLEYVFKHIILKSESDSLISHYEERLNETLGDDYYKFSIYLLDEMCDGEPMDEHKANKLKIDPNIDLHYILKVLTHDGYLTEQDNYWVFEQSLLRQWWQKRKQFRVK